LFLINAELLHEDADLSLSIGSGSWDVGGEHVVTLEEFGVDDSVGETLTRDTDTFKDTIATELIQDDVSIDIVGSLSVVGDDATDEVRRGGREGGHQGAELFLVVSSDSDELSSLLSGLSGRGRGWALATNARAGSAIELGDELVSKEIDDELILGALHGEFEILLEWILVLLEPADGLVLDGTGVVSQAEVVLAETWLLEEWVALVVLIELGEEGVIVGLGDDAFFVKEDEDTMWTLVDQVDRGLRVKTEVNEGPVDLFTEVLLLLELEHVVVEELLQLLVGVVDADLFEGVLLKDFKTGNIEDTNERLGSLLVEDLVGTLDDPEEESSEDGLGQGISGVSSLLDSEVSLDELSSGLDSGLAESLLELGWVDGKELGSDFEGLLVGDGRSFSESLSEGDVSNVEDGHDDLEDGVLLVLGDTADLHGDLGVIELLGVVESVDAGATRVVQVGELLRGHDNEGVLLLGVGTSQELVEDVEVTLSLSLVNDSGLLEQVNLKAGSRNETRSVELKSDEFTETRRVVVLVRLGVTKGFEHGIELDQLVFEGSLLSSATTGDVGNVLNDLLGVFSLTSTRLSTI